MAFCMLAWMVALAMMLYRGTMVYGNCSGEVAMAVGKLKKVLTHNFHIMRLFYEC
jgi:hypothetical protein